MSSLSIFRVATRAVRPASFVRAPIVRSRVQTPVTLAATRARFFGITPKRMSGHEDETYEEFSARYDNPRDSMAPVVFGMRGRGSRVPPRFGDRPLQLLTGRPH